MARATCATLLAASCSVYDASLLERGSSPIASGGAGGLSGYVGGASNASAVAGNGGWAGNMPDDAGSSGMSDLAGEVESVGTAGVVGAAGGGTAGGGTAAGGTAAGGTAGSGTAGSSTSGGGSAGSAGTGGSAVAGSGNAGGSIEGGGGAVGTPPATGCARLSVPLDNASDQAHLVITFPGTVDLSAGTISMRVYVQAGVGGTIFNYAQDPSYHFFAVPPAARLRLASSTGWTTTTWNVGAQPDNAMTNIVKTSIKRVGIEVNTATSTAWSNPTVIYLDSITVKTPTVTQSFTFDTAATLTANPVMVDPASASILWINSGSSDTKATGVTLAWRATCP